MPHAPTSSGWPPSDVTASTIVERAVLARDRRKRSTGFSTPVEVSACTIATMSAGARPSAARSAVGIARASPLHVEPRHRRAVALAHLREPIAEVAGDDDERARAVGDQVRDGRFHAGRAGARHRKRERAVGRAEQPRRAARGRRRGARSSSGSRWLTVGAAIARITRGDVRLGPGPSRMRVGVGQQAHAADSPRNGRARPASAATALSGSGRERRARLARVDPGELQRRLEPGDAVAAASSRASGTSCCCSARASSWRDSRVSVEQPHARVGHHRRERENRRRRRRRTARRRTSSAEPASTWNDAGVLATRSAIWAMSPPDSFMPAMFG